jgi:hypothetical protein
MTAFSALYFSCMLALIAMVLAPSGHIDRSSGMATWTWQPYAIMGLFLFMFGLGYFIGKTDRP